MSISTHVLDTTRGRPAEGLPVVLERRAADGAWRPLGRGITDGDGRVGDLLEPVVPGDYRLTFATGTYNPAGFYPEIIVVFRVTDADQHYHVPLLLGPHQYTTYRGS